MLERRVVDLAQRPLRDDHVQGVAARFLVVDREVLQLSDDVVLLEALGYGSSHQAADEGVLSVGLGLAAVAWVAVDVDGGAEQDVPALAASLDADRRAVLLGEVGVEGGGQRVGGGEGGHSGVAAQTVGGVHTGHRRDA
ncbi:hypothetical protein OOK58_04240 [Streptomyces sp. NBC_01728]|nr:MULTISPECIES: hypothetical protein [unclassified Streptomyces]MCX4461824.1 hypothetical protein [Streptomyces sp. NBC_01719]MCX4490733.1 hypothetical protein [Streptomyces sp. NBC_01728]